MKHDAASVARPKAKAGVRTDRLGDSVVLIDTSSGLAHHLNEIAAVVWDACDGSASIDELVDRMMAKFDIDAATAGRDVAMILRHFQDAGLIEPGDAA